MTHLLVTNDFPPKVGGIQSYLWELWRRLPPETYAVLTIEHEAASAFDRCSGCRVERLPARMLLPGRALRSAIRRLAAEVGAGLVVLDPALPAGLVGPSLELPYAIVLHGAEITVPARVPVLRRVLARPLAGASLLVAAGNYPLAEARRLLGAKLPPAAIVPPGVDTDRFRPLTADERAAARARLGLPPEALVVTSISRLVPRKGFDVLIEAVGALAEDLPRLLCVIGGTGRDAPRLAGVARRARAPVRFLGHVSDADLPLLYGCSDVFAMLCRTRWLGLEQEGYGMVFSEAAAAGVAALAGSSGGSDEAVLDGVTGLVVERPGDLRLVAAALRSLLEDPVRRTRLGAAARRRAEDELGWGGLAERLGESLARVAGRPDDGSVEEGTGVHHRCGTASTLKGVARHDGGRAGG
jgi:phosphatidylinositol alpha-1,6-mannosyltransferase